MGTNVYCTKKLDQKKKDEIIKKVLESETIPELADYIRSLQFSDPAESSISEYAEIHVGKRSGGWKFCFSEDLLRFCAAKWDSIYKFLSRFDLKLYNEYGEVLTPEQFKEEYVDPNKDGWTDNTYFAEHPEESQFWNPENDIYVDDLWFVRGWFE